MTTNLFFISVQITNFSPTDLEWNLLKEFERNFAAEDIESQGLVYITGYIAHKYRHQYPQLGSATKTAINCNDWLSFISRGNCIRPSTDFLKVAEIMNKEFIVFHGDFLNKTNKIFDKLTQIVCMKTNNSFPREFVACLVRTRTYIRLRKLNKDIKINNSIKKHQKS